VGLVGAAALGRPEHIFAPLPYPTTLAEREGALHQALGALLTGAEVTTPDGPDTLADRTLVTKAQGRIFFSNDTGVSDAIFLKAGLTPVRPGVRIDVDHGDVLVSASYRDLLGHKRWHMQFSYLFGSLGGCPHEPEISVRAHVDSVRPNRWRRP
jgi:hypothetical protein